MTRTATNSTRSVLLVAAACLVTSGTPQAAMPRFADRLELPSQVIAITSDRCIQLEQQFDAISGDHAANPNIDLAQSHRDKGSYLCNNDVEDVGEEQLEKALRLLGVEPDPVP